MRISTWLVPLTAAGLFMLSGCGKKPKETPELNNMANEILEDADNDAVAVDNATNEDQAVPAEPVNKAAPPEVSEEEQMREDAEAVGMTSRVRDAEPSDREASNMASAH